MEKQIYIKGKSSCNRSIFPWCPIFSNLFNLPKFRLWRRHKINAAWRKIVLTNIESSWMEEKYIKFYQSFHKAFKNKKSNSLFKTNQSLLNKERFLGWLKKSKIKIMKNLLSKYGKHFWYLPLVVSLWSWWAFFSLPMQLRDIWSPLFLSAFAYYFFLKCTGRLTDKDDPFVEWLDSFWSIGNSRCFYSYARKDVARNLL